MIALQILKIIGIVLACIIGLIIVIILLVIFAPFQYTVSAVGENEAIEAKLNVKWLFGFLNLDIGMDGGKIDMKTIVVGKVLEKKENSLATRIAKAVGLWLWKEVKILVLGIDDSKKEEKPQEANEEENCSKLKKTVRKVTGIIKKVWNILKVSKYTLGAPVTKRAWAYFKERLFIFWNHLRPRSFKGKVVFGTGDPADTAEAYAAAGCIAAMLDERLVIVPDMENRIIDSDVAIRGRIFVGCVLSFLWKLLTNKDIRRVVGYLGRNL